MLEFVRKYFAKIFEFSIMLGVIFFTIIGGILGYVINQDFVMVIVFGVLGLLLGLFFVIICGGLTATFLNIDANINDLSYNIKSIINGQTQEIREYIQNIAVNKNDKTDENKSNIYDIIEGQKGKIIENTFLYQEDNFASKKIKDLNIGTIIEINKNKGSWYFIALDETVNGFIYSKSVELL